MPRTFPQPPGGQPAPPGTSGTADKRKRKHMRVHMGTCKVDISSQARKKEGDEADSWGKDKETCELSQKTRSYPGLGESWS